VRRVLSTVGHGVGAALSTSTATLPVCLTVASGRSVTTSVKGRGPLKPFAG
jgi:hypothetical protein